MKLEAVNLANREHFVSIKGETTGQTLYLREFTYGALVPDIKHPLSSVSVSNSSLSIDLWVGCSWQCKYCHVQGTLQDLAANGRMPREPIRRSTFSVKDIIEALIKHPFFVPNDTLISIGTASTEPFAAGPVLESTFRIMEEFGKHGLLNPFWIVTKAGVPPNKKRELLKIISRGSPIVISVCWADNPARIEPAQANRFSHIAQAKDAGVKTNWYMRPLVKEWGATYEHIKAMMQWVSENYGNYIDSITPGGLRWTEGIENGLVEIHQERMPDVPKNDNVKALSDDVWRDINVLGSKFFPGIPIHRHSSCGLSYLLERPSINLTQWFAREDCEASLCSHIQRAKCSKSAACIQCIKDKELQEILDDIGVPARITGLVGDHGILMEPPASSFTYAVRQTVIHRLSNYAYEHAEGNNCQTGS